MDIPIPAAWPPPSDMPAGDLALACFLLWGFDHLLRRQLRATRRRGRNLIAKVTFFLHEKIRVFLRHSTHSQTSQPPDFSTSRLQLRWCRARFHNEYKPNPAICNNAAAVDVSIGFEIASAPSDDSKDLKTPPTNQATTQT